MANTHNKVKCVGCGKITDMELVFIESLTPPPRLIEEQLLSKPGEEEPAAVEREDEPTDDVITLTLGECSECGNSHWLRLGEMSVTMAPPKDEKVEKPKELEKPPAKKHKCVACGEMEEIDLDEMPICAICGALDWEKVPI